MINVAICDDEKYYRDLIYELVSIYLKKIKLEYQIDIYDSGKVLCEKGMEEKEYDIVFLDINMDDMNGMETAQYIRKKNMDTFIVFITAFVTYSPEGYKVNAIRYLLKDNQSFGETLIECLDTIFGKINVNKIKYKFNCTDGDIDILLDRILYIESKLHKLELHMYSKNKEVSYTLYGKLDDFTIEFEKYDFVRVHQSYLVNLKYVKQVNNYRLMLDNGKDLPVVRQKFKKVKEFFILYKGEF